MKQTREIIERAFKDHRPAIAYSGGGDSAVLLDIVHGLGHRPPLIITDSQMEYASSIPFAQAEAARYGLELHVAKAKVTPPEQWKKTGFPLLGKLAAAVWMQRHRDRDFGFRLCVSSCCRNLKILPGRRKAKELGCDAMLTGQRGAQDDRLRGLRAHKDGNALYLKADKLWQFNPLDGWTDTMIRRYHEQHALPQNPAKAKGALTIGCLYCGGGAQFDNSGFRVLRKADPKAWRRIIVEYGFGPVILAVKYDQPLAHASAALDRLGGLEHVADTMPHVFDFLRKHPLKGYVR